VLNREQVSELNKTLEEYVELVKESVEYNRDQLSAADAQSKPARSEVSALILAGRGIFDAAAAQLVAQVIRLELGMVTRCPSLGGLTGIGAAAEAEAGDPPNIVALVSVGAVTSAQLRLLRHRMDGTFPRSQIMVGYWDAAQPIKETEEKKRVYYADSAGSLVDQVARTADEITHKENGKPGNGGSTRRLEIVSP
jgi:hypothetical protein